MYHSFIIHALFLLKLPIYLYVYWKKYLPTYLPTCLHMCLPTYLHTVLSTYLLSYLPAYLPIYLPSCIYIHRQNSSFRTSRTTIVIMIYGCRSFSGGIVYADISSDVNCIIWSQSSDRFSIMNCTRGMLGLQQCHVDMTSGINNVAYHYSLW